MCQQPNRTKTTTGRTASLLALAAVFLIASTPGPKQAETPTEATVQTTAEVQLDPTAAAEPDVDQIVARVQAFYDGVQDYHADFEQRYTNLAAGDVQVSSGHVFFKKPGRMRWDYADPEPKHLISNGETLWMYEPEFQQVARVDLAASDLPTAVRFLMGEGNLAEDFRVTLNECDREGMHCLHLVPRRSQGQYRALDFIVSGTNYSVVETTIVDPVGNTNQFVFSNVVTSDELPSAGFEFTPTDDMRVINQ